MGWDPPCQISSKKVDRHSINLKRSRLNKRKEDEPIFLLLTLPTCLGIFWFIYYFKAIEKAISMFLANILEVT